MTTRAQAFAGSVLLAVVVAPPLSYAHSGLTKHFPSLGGDVELVGQVIVTQSASSDGDLCLEIRNAYAWQDYPNVIIDVFSYPQQEFLKEGTHFCSEMGCTNARVVLPKPSSDQQLTIIVRGAPGSYFQSSVPLSATTHQLMGQCSDPWSGIGYYDIEPGQRITISDGLMGKTHVSTVEEQGGTNDSILMAFNGDTPFAFDDNGGVAQMSFLCLPKTCEAGHCYILPARRSRYLTGTPPADDPTRFTTPKPGPVTVIWDEGAHDHRDDIDNDGLGTELEIRLGTCDPDHPNNDMDGDGTSDCYDPDVDGDGIPDALEVYGRGDMQGWSRATYMRDQNMSTSLGRFPYYGADPTRQDLFVEAAWAPRCKHSENVLCTPKNPNDTLNSDFWKWTDVIAVDYARKFAPEVTVHVDIGDPLSWTNPSVVQTDTFGNWGVRRLPDSFDPASEPGLLDLALNRNETWWCGDHRVATSPRFPSFLHLVVAREPILTRGFCPRVDDRAGGAAHETGHFLGLHHSGHRACDEYLFGEYRGQCYGTDGEINCKPHYLSVMNYAYQDDPNFGQGSDFPGFSHGRFLAPSTGSGDVVLDPANIDEGKGLWPGGGFDPVNDEPVLKLMEEAFGRLVDRSTGGIDWDMDGNIPLPGQSTRAFVNRAPTVANSGDCDTSPPARDSVALIPSTIGGSLYGGGWSPSATLTPVGDGFALYVAYNCHLDNRCHPSIYRSVFACDSTGDNPCRNGQPWSKYVELTSNAFGLTAVGDIVIFVDGQTNELKYAGRSASGAVVGGKLGGPPVAGPPSAVLDLPAGSGPVGDIRVYAAVTETSGGTSSTTLRLWKYDAASDSWSFPGATQYWSNGDPIQMLPGTAIGLTRGYRSDVFDTTGIPTEQLFAAIPALTGATGAKELRLAMLENAGIDVNTVCTQLGVRFHIPIEVCLATAIQLSDRWAPLANDIWLGRGGTPPVADVGRVGLAFRPQDPSVWTGPKGGRFYLTWQTKDSGGAQAHMSLTRGHVMPLSATNAADTVFGLVFLPESYVYKESADWPAGMALIYAGGHIRGAGTDEVVQSRYFPHVDGIFASQQRDHDDMAHIKKRLACALSQCDSLNDD
jgi:hypothetical protein